MFCDQCGSKVPDAAVFCPKCGSSLTEQGNLNSGSPSDDANGGNAVNNAGAGNSKRSPVSHDGRTWTINDNDKYRYQNTQTPAVDSSKRSPKWVILIPATLMAVIGVLTMWTGVSHYTDSTYVVDIISEFVDSSSTILGKMLFWSVCAIIEFLCIECIAGLFISARKSKVLIVTSSILTAFGLAIWISGQALNMHLPDSLFMVALMWTINAYYQAVKYVMILSAICLILGIAFKLSGTIDVLDGSDNNKGGGVGANSAPVSVSGQTGSVSGRSPSKGDAPFPVQPTKRNGGATELMTDTEIVDTVDPYGSHNGPVHPGGAATKRHRTDEPVAVGGTLMPKGKGSDPSGGQSKGIFSANSILDRNELVMLTREEAMMGCKKSLMIDGRKLNITIPSNTTAAEKIVLKGHGRTDKNTGKRGDLIIQFYIT